ncbi:hypothetical protein FACS1894200_13110 [Spirochaetia bacterium]|nr:hypothetical protein FACS1894200_13110 [Spirochaetia bacterium]
MALHLSIFMSIRKIPREDWNNLTRLQDIPFLDWEWLCALEDSGSIVPRTGWQPLHFTLWDAHTLKAAAPFYLKSNSEGEYVYDYFWAEAAAKLGLTWYPKLVACCPASPAEGYRFLCAPDIDEAAACAVILEAAQTLCLNNRIVSLNILFADPTWAPCLPAQDYTAWEHSHYEWTNQGFTDFEDYLSCFNKNQRKNIRKEYRSHKEQGIAIKIIPGEEASKEHFKRMFELYTLTNDKFAPWDARYVNEAFFMLLEKQYRHALTFVEAREERSGTLIALAFLVRKGSRVFGRYWGAYEEVRDLHFAACYYAPIDWAIQNGIERFDPGAGSPHKIRRGFVSVRDYSYHRFFDPVLSRLFAANIAAVNQYEQDLRAELNAASPLIR